MQRDLPAKYYLDHFNEFISYITDNCRHLLEDKHLSYLQTFKHLDEDAQCLLVRILNRKGEVVKKSTLQYQEIKDIPQALSILKLHQLVGDVTEDTFIQAIHSLTKLELIELTQHDPKEHPLPAKSANKALWIQWIIDNLSYAAHQNHPLMQSLLVNYQSEIFGYLLFLFFGNLKGKLNQFSLRDMGIMGTRKHHVQNNVRFQERDHALSAYFYALKNQSLQRWTQEQLIEEVSLLKKFPKAQGAIAIKEFNSFTLRLGKALLPINQSLALKALEQSDDPQAIEKRIREWYKLGQLGRVKTALENIIDTPSSEHLFIFATDFLERKFNKKRTSILTDMLRNGPDPITMDEAFINDVEIGVINHHRRNGLKAIRSENQPWRALFALTFWPELFDHPKTGLCSEFDYLPKVLKENSFYKTVHEEIDNRINGLNSNDALRKWIIHQWTLAYGKSNGIFYWRSDLLETVLTLIDHSDIKALQSHLLDMSKFYNELNDGYPDIFIVDNHQLRFEEIKAPGDQLRRNQLIIIQKLKRLGWDVRIQTVEWRLNPQQPYVVVDIETTGGGQGNHRITEVGMVKVLEGTVIEEWQSLINPQRHIPKYITKLTGISNEMVADAPLFSEVVDEVSQFCEGCIFVAHNVNFDYGFFKQEYEQLERHFRLPKLCTVRLAKRHLPGHDSYSLGKLCNDLGITLENHHRALDDAKAAAELLIKVNNIRSLLHPASRGT